jgi:peptide deformylase
MRLNKRVLYQVAKPVDISKTGFVQDLAEALFDTMTKNNGIGLAAPQCGIPRQIFVMSTDGQQRVVINPQILTVSKNLCIMTEGCLSFPNEYLDISRPETITVEYYNSDIQLITETLTGLSARCFLHEFDHLKGITMQQKRKNFES